MNTRDKLEEIIRLGKLMTEVTDEDFLLERILTEARRFASADAGTIYKCQKGMLHLRYSQNDTKQSKLPDGQKLIYSTMSFPIDRLKISGYVAETGEILNIPDVYKISPKSSYQFGKIVDVMAGYKTKSMLSIPLKTGTSRIVGVLQLINAKDKDGNVVPFKNKEIPFFEHLANNAAVALEKAELTRTIILRMISMAELRDPLETGPHVNRVGAYSAELYEVWARKNKIPESEIDIRKDMLRVASMLHDVGKVAVPDHILKKPGKLTPEEYDIIKQHALLGFQLFKESSSELEIMAAEIALRHHESWDGTGYPGHYSLEKDLDSHTNHKMGTGLKGEEISIWGRIVKIADVYDALSRPRVYKEAWDQAQVMDELERCSGSAFDPELIEIFTDNIDRIQRISALYND